MHYIQLPVTTLRHTIVAMIGLGCCAFTPLKNKPEPASSPASVFVLGESTPMLASQYCIEELSARFPAFQPKPPSNEYSHVVLPFEGGPDENDKLKAYAFSFLLSNALDWGPGCYCSRHAYFTFKRSNPIALHAAMRFRPTAIAEYAKQWKATHVIGGDIQSSPKGYTGTLKIFDQKGRSIHETHFDVSGRYFDLLGSMSVEGLRVLGYEPSPLLAAHLRIPRCKDERLLVDLGRAAFADERSKEEFGIYRAILEKEPGFAEVRYWWANQSHWVTDDNAAYHRDLARSLQSYVTCIALEDVFLNPTKGASANFGYEWTTPGNAKGANFNYDWMIGEAERLTGSNTPVMWTLRFKSLDGRNTTPSLAQAMAAAEVATRYPNNFKLIMELMGNNRDGSKGPWRGNFSMIASLAVATLQCRSLPSSYASSGAARRLSTASRELGYPGIAAQMLAPLYAQSVSEGSRNDTVTYAWRLAEVLQDMGQYDASFQAGVVAVKACDDDVRPFYLLNALISGLIAGRTNQVEALAARYDRELAAKPSLRTLLKSYQAMARGDYESVQAYAKTNPVSTLDLGVRARLDRLMLFAELDLKLGKTDYRKQVHDAACLYPAIRPLWILFDAYDHKDPQPEIEGFYEALGWLHDDDPWVRQAIAARAHRMPSPPEFDLKGTLATMDNYPPSPWPVMQAAKLSGGYGDILLNPPAWEYTRAAKRMLSMREYARADELVRQCLVAASFGAYFKSMEPHFTHLYYLVQAAKAKDHEPELHTLPPAPTS